MKLLGLDTSTEACSAALLVDGRAIERFERVRNGHSARLLPMVRTLLAEAGLALGACDAIAFGRGPGSFTALRIGIGVAQGLALGADLPVLPVSSLAALAQGQRQAGHIVAAFDARMEQVYWGCYARGADGLVAIAGEEAVSAPSAVRVPDTGTWQGAGGGWDRYADQLSLALDGNLAGWTPDQHPHAADLLALAAAAWRRGEAVDAAAALPTYLRDDVARKMGAGGM